jgi:hypothetical protein
MWKKVFLEHFTRDHVKLMWFFCTGREGDIFVCTGPFKGVYVWFKCTFFMDTPKHTSTLF